MRYPKIYVFLLFSALTPMVFGQWITQTIELKQGWNAVFLHVDPSHTSLSSSIGADGSNPITQVWRWNPPTTAQFFNNPQDATFDVSGWVQWIRNKPASVLKSMVGDTAYLVESATEYTWTLKGRPLPPRHFWNIEGLNLIGFPAVEVNPPKFDEFLAEASELQSAEVEIFRYDGPTLNENNPKPVPPILFRSTPVARGQAFWMRSGDVFNKYFGPFEVKLSGSSTIDFHETISVYSFRLRNLTDNELTVSMKLMNSESPPTGQAAIAGAPHLLVRETRDLNSLHFGFSEISAGPGSALSWTLAARDEEGSEVEVVLGLDRSVISAPEGSLLAGILQFTDSLGHIHVNVPVRGTVSSDAGLWVGEAKVAQVNQYLKTYESGSSDPIITTNGTTIVTNDLVIAEDGGYSVSHVDTEITAVAKPFPLRLIVHSPESGPATLLQHVFYGFNVYSNQVISRQQSVLDPNRYDDARRITATHLPWTADNEGWVFNGALEQGDAIMTSVSTGYDDQRSNPFLHTYHPDHDNLDPDFKEELSRGAESYTITRSISLDVAEPGTNFNDRVSGGQTIYGQYLETIEVTGLARAGGTSDTRTFEVRGAFKLDRVSDIPQLTDPL